MILEKSNEERTGVTSRVRGIALAGFDRTLAVLAHAGIGLGLFGVGFLASLAISAVIWLRSRHSPGLHRESEQAGTYQLLVFIVNIAVAALWAAGFIWLLNGAGSIVPRAGDPAGLFVLAGVLLLAVPFFAVWYFGTILYGLLAAFAVARGRLVVYPFTGEWVDRRLRRAGKFS